MPEFILPGPVRIWNEFLRMVAVEKLWHHTGITALEVVVGFVLGSLLGMVIGYVLGVSPRAELVLSPTLTPVQRYPAQQVGQAALSALSALAPSARHWRLVATPAPVTQTVSAPSRFWPPRRIWILVPCWPPAG